MSRITAELSPEFVNGVLQDGVEIPAMIATLQEKGWELSRMISTLEELEGPSEVDGDLRILISCPMVPVLKEIKKANAAQTGAEALPDFYPQIVAEYTARHPEDAAILHPLCIAHQQIRKAFGERSGLEIQQIACRSAETGKVVHSRTGLSKISRSEEEATRMLDTRACIYRSVAQ